MNRPRLLLTAGIALLAGACVPPLRSASGQEAPAPEDRQLLAAFPNDLGPERLDVAAYPERQRANYEVYAKTCSRCHTLARSLNAPPASPPWWRFYLLRMRMRANLAGRPITSSERQAVLEFLEYDERTRKKSSEFQKSSLEIEKRFNRVMDERVRKLLESYRFSDGPPFSPGP